MLPDLIIVLLVSFALALSVYAIRQAERAWPRCAGRRVAVASAMGLGLLRFNGHRDRFRVRCSSDARDPSCIPRPFPPADGRSGPRRP